MPYGRPMKGASRRVPTTVHLPTGTLDIIDNYIDDREKNVESGRMSRSDFINEAVNRYLVEHVLADLAAAGFTVAINRDLPPNDGCISLGEAVVASARSGE